MPKVIDTIFVEKEEIKEDFLNFLSSKPTKYFLDFEEAYEDVKEILKSERFIPMKDGYCYDKQINACWLGLCEDNFSYMDEIYSECDYDDTVKKLRKYYKNNKIDIPTKDELKVLTKLTKAPFSLSSKRPSKPAYCILAKEKDKVQAYDIDNGSFSKRSYGYIHPIYRLENNFKLGGRLSDHKHFIIWIMNGLKPKGLKSKSYDNALEQKSLSALENFLSIKINDDMIIDNILKTDKTRANLIEYDKKLLLDINKGSWEVYRASKEKNFKEPISLKLTTSIVAKDPKESIVKGGVIGIDFGTKSTVVVYQKNDESIYPIRVGMGDWKKKEEPYHYENPTVMEFINLKSFLDSYDENIFRPYTKWDDLTISHTAFENLKNSHSNNFSAYLTELKQWAGDKNRKLKVKDLNENIFELKEFEKLQEDDLNPIETYAYYLGLYINQQHSDTVYLEYLLSFPVTYDLNIREKILSSFKRGIAKSLPDIGEEADNLKVTAGVSEPAAYAAIAVQEYGLAEENTKNFYGIFDFGGGTTDFDFGIFRESDEDDKKERRYDYVIEHFGAGGDKYLGGENLLELLAFEVFKKNKDILRENNISFELPPECKEFLGSELLLSDSREAKLNMVNLIKELRPFWERESFDKEFFTDGLKVDLYDNDANKQAGVELDIDEEELKEVLIQRIKKGVDSFFESLAKSFFSYKDEIDFDIEVINIFLAGNSSKSPIVKELFVKRIEQLKKEFEQEKKVDMDTEILMFYPLDNHNDFTKPNGKTGVAFGLIETRPGGSSVLVIDKNITDNNIKFNYYLGKNKRKKFKIVVDRDDSYNTWYEFIDAGYESFEIYYTSSPLAIRNDLKINDESIKKIRLSIPKDLVDENSNIFIKLVSSTCFEYGVGKDNDNINTIQIIELGI